MGLETSECVARFILSRIDTHFSLEDIGPYWALGEYKPDGTLLGGFLYTNYVQVGPDDDHNSIDVHVAGDWGCFNRYSFPRFFHFGFNTLGCCRMVGYIKEDNKRARRLAENRDLSWTATYVLASLD